MKETAAHLFLGLLLALLVAACSGTGAPSERVERFWIGPELEECVGVGPQQCMQVSRTADGAFGNFYDQIDGFTHQAGTSYVIDVAITDVEDPPADASSVTYRLVEIVESS